MVSLRLSLSAAAVRSTSISMFTIRVWARARSSCVTPTLPFTRSPLIVILSTSGLQALARYRLGDLHGFGDRSNIVDTHDPAPLGYRPRNRHQGPFDALVLGHVQDRPEEGLPRRPGKDRVAEGGQFVEAIQEDEV